MSDDYTLRTVNIGNVVYDNILYDQVELKVKRVAHEHQVRGKTVANVRRLHNKSSSAKELLDLFMPFCANMRYVLFSLCYAKHGGTPASALQYTDVLLLLLPPRFSCLLGNHLRQCAPYLEESGQSEVNAICKRFALFLAHILSIVNATVALNIILLSARSSCMKIFVASPKRCARTSRRRSLQRTSKRCSERKSSNWLVETFDIVQCESESYFSLKNFLRIIARCRLFSRLTKNSWR